MFRDSFTTSTTTTTNSSRVAEYKSIINSFFYNVLRPLTYHQKIFYFFPLLSFSLSLSPQNYANSRSNSTAPLSLHYFHFFFTRLIQSNWELLNYLAALHWESLHQRKCKLWWWWWWCWWIIYIKGKLFQRVHRLLLLLLLLLQTIKRRFSNFVVVVTGLLLLLVFNLWSLDCGTAAAAAPV